MSTGITDTVSLAITGDDHVEAATGEFLGDQLRGFTIIFDAKDFSAYVRHRRTGPDIAGHLPYRAPPPRPILGMCGAA